MTGSALLTYGPTLARRMDADAARALLARIDPDRAVGIAHVVVTRTSTPDGYNVEFVPDELTADQAIVAMAVATRRLAQLYGRAPEPGLLVAQDHAEVLRRVAEHIVDHCRGAQVSAHGHLLTKQFDRSREDCVRDVQIAIALAAITPERLARGI